LIIPVYSIIMGDTCPRFNGTDLPCINVINQL
jgi:hypothetical protein